MPKKGGHHSLESRRKMSESHKGQVPWNKGKKTGLIPWNKGLTKENDPRVKKLAELMKGNQHNKGRRFSDLHRHRISEGLKGNTCSRERVLTEHHKKRISASNKGRNFTEQHKENLSKSRKGKTSNMLGHKHTEESKRKMSASHKGYICSAETAEKISRANKGKKFSEETKQKMREAALKRGHRHKFKNTSIELALQEELNRREIRYETHIPICKTCTPDILFSDLKTAVFADGNHWHSKEFKNGAVWERDRRQDKILRENDWQVLRFWGNEIREDVSGCVDMIVAEIT